ncbi:MAG TPA: PBP1A family penicillin-binding protein [Vicinamibacterales bacterium]|nr:PBP1A family penicillin-binding protein [Vicinamibacterales bacterium]
MAQNLFAKFFRRAGIVALFILAAVLGTASGVLFAYSGDLPAIEALDDYTPSTITRVYDSRGKVVGDFAIQRREVITYEQISPTLRQAILAAEDDEFFQHFGLSIPRIVLTLMKDILERRKAAGASTLTQQLARNLFPVTIGFEKTWERKIKEAIVAIQLEKRYTKQEIFTFYCNQIHLGHGAYGVEAASRLYFAKSAKDLTLDEAALIAGIIQAASRQSPYVNMDAARRRRGYVLQRMADLKYISQAEADAAKARPITVRGEPGQDRTIAPYFLEEVRKQLEARYGVKPLYEGGLTVQTTLDSELQLAANAAVGDGLRTLDKRRGWRRPARNVVAEGHTLSAFKHPRWERPVGEGDIVPALVTELDGARIRLRVGSRTGLIEPAGYAWTRRKAPQLVKPGDLVELRVRKIDPDGSLAGTLEQPPALEGALLAIENRTGRILAMVGGYSFDRSKFNRATQAARQVGSAFKPFVYTAAVDRGYTPVSTILDEPTSFPTGPNQAAYSPQNYDREYWGTVTLRRALEQSRNVPAVKMMNELGPQQVISYARRLGITSPLPPYLAVALGAAEATLLEMTSAYSVYPNQGVRMAPFEIVKVTDREGNVLEEHRPEPRDAIRADTAYVMTNLLRGVVLRGTAAKAAEIQWPLAGKTGTTDDYTDAWFIGFDPEITVGIWIGHDQKKSIGPGFTGSEAALPAWIDFMKRYVDDRKPPAGFEPPGNIVFVAIDRTTGEAVEPGTPGTIQESFIAGTQPGAAVRQ